jgi:hypothetical protein
MEGGWKWVEVGDDVDRQVAPLMPDLARNTPVDSALVACDPPQGFHFAERAVQGGAQRGPEDAHSAVLW